MKSKLLYLLLFCSAYDNYQPFPFLDDLDYSQYYAKTKVSDIETEYKITSYSEYYAYILKLNLQDINNELFLYVKKNYKVEKQCISVPNVHIIILSEEMLNKKKKEIGYEDPDLINGLFLMSNKYFGTATIFLSSRMKTNLDLELIAHEMAHYWYERLCLRFVTDESSEEFAYKFGRFYLNKIGDKK